MSGTAPSVAQIQVRRHHRALRWLAFTMVASVLVAAFVLPLININRYHRTISETLARSIGHPVHLGSVKLQLLPRPGLAISDFVVEESPEFGAEPLLRSPAVVVSLRLTSLWRGRLEVSRIDLDEASVNLVHDPTGKWNFASLLEQASRIPNAPTAQRHSSSTPRFPYIQFKSARINFKFGDEKQGFAFLNSDLSIWLDNPQQWRLRFEAQPARTDLALQLEDTGLMRVEGSLDRAPALDQMPVKLHAEWNRAELGQASRMIFADDSGWRGDLRVEADIVGDISDLHLTTRVRVANTHRQEFSPLMPLNVDTRCRAEYRHGTQALDNLTCLWPVGDGHLLLTGDVQHFFSPQAHLNLEINQTPASFAVNVLGLIRASLLASPSATGLINGNFAYATDAAMKLSGQATIEPLSLKLSDDSAPFVLPAMHFSTHAAAPTQSGLRNKKAHAIAAQVPTSGTIFLDVPATNMGAPNPLQLSGQFTADGFSLRLTGQSGIGRLKDLSSSFGALRPWTTHLVAQGFADMDLTFAGPWLTEPSASADAQSALPDSAIQGWLRLQNSQAKLDWLPEPMEIASATVNFGGGRVRWSNASVSINGVAVRGSADAALRCDSTAVCPMHFNVDIPQLDAAALQSSLLGAGRHGELLNAILAEVERKTAPWPEMNGQAHVGTFTLGALALADVRSSISVEDHRLQITSLDASALGGSMHANATVEASGSKPQYSVQADWSGIDVADIAELFKEKWPATGAMDGGVHLALQGYSLSDLADGAQGTFHWLWRAGSLMGAAGAAPEKASTPMHFSEWSASGSVADRTLALNKVGAANPVSGTVSFDGKLDLLWPASGATSPIHVGGTLANPAVISAETAAK
jgi:AsmA family/AsmA-like C-terminal region